MFELEKFKPGMFLLPKTQNMHVPGLIISNEKIFADEELQRPLEQVANVATLPGILGYSIAMPDMHWGYGFPIGGVAAMDVDSGVISPGGVGYDINCGVRLALVPIQYDSLKIGQRSDILNALFHIIPSGAGQGRSKKLSDEDYRAIAAKGAKWSIEQGFGFESDLEYMESYGFISGADANVVSELAKRRGAEQLGSIGSGNHFVEIGKIEAILLPEIAAAWGVKQGETYVLIHSGSRGFGHQICQDTLDSFMRAGFAKGLVDKQLVSAPFKSAEGQTYFSAMATAANYAFNNRQQILHLVRRAFFRLLNIAEKEIRLLYDVCHNIAKIESHEVQGKIQKVCVHRKGATRAFGRGHPELNPLFKTTGQPVLVPGDMGTASYLMVGEGNPLTFCSCCHGAGRAKSRAQALKEWGNRDLIKHMRSLGILVEAHSKRTIAEEMPDAYKDVSDVVDIAETAGLSKKVARLKPGMVLKG